MMLFLFSSFLYPLVIYAACLCRLILLRALLLASSPQPGFTRIAAALVCFLPVPAAPGGRGRGGEGGCSFAPLHLSCKSFRPRARKWKNEQMNFYSRKDEGFAVRHTAGKVIRNTLKIIGRVDFGGETAVAFFLCLCL